MEELELKQLVEKTMPVRDRIIKHIRDTYKDFPKFLHDAKQSGTSGDLVIDEIAWMAIRDSYDIIRK